MPVFKKRTFAGGGRSSSLFNNPGMGLGLEYLPTAQELPDLEGLLYVEQAKNNARTQLEALRKEYSPDVSELLKGLDGLDMFTSVKEGFKRDIQQDVSSFLARMKADPDFAFSMDARHEFNALQSRLRSSNYQSQALRYREVEKDYSNALSKGLGEEMYVSNGMIPVVDRNTGAMELMSIPRAKALFDDPETASRYTTFGKSSQLFDYYHRFATPRTESYLSFSGRSTAREARKEVDEVFKNVASSMVDGISYDDIANKSGVAVYQQFREKTQSNTEQLSQAIDQVIRTLSQQSLDALRGDFIQRTGDLSEKGFEGYMINYLSGEGSLRSQMSTSIDSDVQVLSADLQDRVQGRSDNLYKPVETKESFALRESNFFPDLGKKNLFTAPVVAKSSRPSNVQAPVERRVFNERLLVYNGDFFGPTGKDGKIETKSVTLHQVNYRGSFLLPLATGEVITFQNGQYRVETDSNITPGSYFASKEGSNLLMGSFKLENTQRQTIRVGNQDYMVYPSTDKNKYIVVSPKAFASYEGYEEPGSEKSHTVVFRPLDPTESTQDFSNPAFSVDYAFTNFFDPNTEQLTSEGKDFAATLNESLSEKIESLQEAKKLERPKSQADEIERNLAQLNAYRDEISAKLSYLEAVKSGTVVLKTAADSEEYEKIRFQINALLNELKNNRTIETTREITSVIDNSFRVSRTYNNLIR